jgi:hypothetical protein
MRFAARDGDFVVVTPPAQLTDALVDALLSELAEHLLRGEPYVLLFDLSATGLPNATQRRKLAEHMATHEAIIRNVVRGIAIVAPNPLVRGMVTALFWVVPPPIASHMCGSHAEALEWARGVMPSAELRQNRRPS